MHPTSEQSTQGSGFRDFQGVALRDRSRNGPRLLQYGILHGYCILEYFNSFVAVDCRRSTFWALRLETKLKCGKKQLTERKNEGIANKFFLHFWRQFRFLCRFQFLCTNFRDQAQNKEKKTPIFSHFAKNAPSAFSKWPLLYTMYMYSVQR